MDLKVAFVNRHGLETIAKPIILDVLALTVDMDHVQAMASVNVTPVIHNSHPRIPVWEKCAAVSRAITAANVAGTRVNVRLDGLVPHVKMRILAMAPRVIPMATVSCSTVKQGAFAMI